MQANFSSTPQKESTLTTNDQFMSNFAQMIYTLLQSSAKNIRNETVNSEESMRSNHSNKRELSEIINQNPSLQDSKQLEIFQLPDEQIQLKTQPVQLEQNILQENSQHYIKSNIQEPTNGVPLFTNNHNNFSNNKSYDQISNISQINQKKIKIKVYSFYYDQNRKEASNIIPVEFTKQIPKQIFFQTILPLISVMIILIAIYYIQRQINDYCYIDSLCPCNSFGVKVWSWFRQLIIFKLALVVYRKKVICSLVVSKEREPVMEYTILILLTCGIDILLVWWIENNTDYVFVIVVYVIGVIILLNTFRIRDWIRVFCKGSAIILYDFNIICLICFAFYAFPEILDEMKKQFIIYQILKFSSYGSSLGKENFAYIYPLLDWCMEIFIDGIYSHTIFAELFIYQSQLIIIGCRIGMVMLYSWDTFEFWYLLLISGFLRINNSSMYLTVLLRRQIYYLSPKQLQRIFAMDENSDSLKGKHGAYLEHTFTWIFFLYFFWITESSLPFYTQKFTSISNCSFRNENWDQIIYWYQPIIIYCAYIIFEFVSILLNKKTKFDNIKWLGGTGLNFVENVLTRMMGYYLFQFGIMSIIFLKKIRDQQNNDEGFIQKML